MSSLNDPKASTGITTSSTSDAAGNKAGSAEAELRKATQYWGTVYSKDPSDGEAAYNYARNLKSLGEKQQALMVLQSSVDMTRSTAGILSEYGRLALEFDQISLAQKLLERADDPLQPDWRIISARGTVFASRASMRKPSVLRARHAVCAGYGVRPEQPRTRVHDGWPAGEGRAAAAEGCRNRQGRRARAENLVLVLGPDAKRLARRARSARPGAPRCALRADLPGRLSGRNAPGCPQAFTA